jgi:hypothetical protein
MRRDDGFRWPASTSPTSSRPSTGGASAPLARRRHRLPRGARAGRGLRAAGLLPRERVRRGQHAGRRQPPGWPGMPARPTRPASRSARPARATPSARAAAAPRTRCRHWTAMSPGAKRAVWRRITMGSTPPRPGASTASAERRAGARAAPGDDAPAGTRPTAVRQPLPPPPTAAAHPPQPAEGTASRTAHPPHGGAPTPRL